MKVLRLLSVAAVIGGAIPAVAQTTPLPAATTSAPKAATRIAFVDIELVIENSRAIRMAMDALDKDLAERAKTVDAKEREFRRQRFELDRQERVLSQGEREKRRAELSTLQEDINRLKFEFEQEMRARERQIEPVLERIMEIVGDVAERDGFDLVVRGEVVIYGRDAANLTPKVVEAVDARATEIVALFRSGAAATKTNADDSDTSPTETIRMQRNAKRAGELLPLVP